MNTNKYSAKLTTVKGRTFHSKREALRWLELDAMHRKGEISNLRCQVKIPLSVDQVCIGHYVADFVYWDGVSYEDCVSPPDSAVQQPVIGAIVEDSKGHRTAMYKWKKKHFEAQYGIEIKET